MLYAILAGGPSLTQEIVDQVMASSAFVIAINNSWKLAPKAHALFAADAMWWLTYPEAKQFVGRKFVCQAQRVPEAEFVHPYPCHPGSNSALQATAWAIANGATKVALFGVDLRDDELTHWHGLHGGNLLNPAPIMFQRARMAWEQFAKTVQCSIVNASPSSALRCFASVTVGEALVSTI